MKHTKQISRSRMLVPTEASTTIQMKFQFIQDLISRAIQFNFQKGMW